MSIAVAPRPRNFGEIASWLQKSDDLRAGHDGDARHSGYVTVGDLHFHVANTVEGAIVSLVQWRKSAAAALQGVLGMDAPLIPQHNLFAVTSDQRDAALEAWRVKVRNEAQIETAPRKRLGAGHQR